MAYEGVVVRPDGSLYCDISIESLGFPSFTPLCSLPIKYDGKKFQEMGRLFVAQARTTCPVDTGFLRDHNDFTADEGGIEMWSEATYSAYQEYGTSRCRAQPWFESSIQSALANSGIREAFMDTKMRYETIDGELMSIQNANPTSIAGCYALIDRIYQLQADLAGIGLFVEGLEEKIQDLMTQIHVMTVQLMQQMIMESLLTGGKGGQYNMTLIEQIIVAFAVGFIMAIIRAIMDSIFNNSKADPNPHNPSH